MGIPQTLFPQESKIFETFCNFLSSTPLFNLPSRDSRWRADSKRSNRNKKLKKKPKRRPKPMARTRRNRHKLLSSGSALCVSLKCQILKPTNNTLKANIRKHQCQKNSRISREHFAEAEMAIQFDTNTQTLSQDTCYSADQISIILAALYYLAEISLLKQCLFSCNQIWEKKSMSPKTKITWVWMMTLYFLSIFGAYLFFGNFLRHGSLSNS